MYAGAVFHSDIHEKKHSPCSLSSCHHPVISLPCHLPFFDLFITVALHLFLDPVSNLRCFHPLALRSLIRWISCCNFRSIPNSSANFCAPLTTECCRVLSLQTLEIVQLYDLCCRRYSQLPLSLLSYTLLLLTSSFSPLNSWEIE